MDMAVVSYFYLLMFSYHDDQYVDYLCQSLGNVCLQTIAFFM